MTTAVVSLPVRRHVVPRDGGQHLQRFRVAVGEVPVHGADVEEIRQVPLPELQADPDDRTDEGGECCPAPPGGMSRMKTLNGPHPARVLGHCGPAGPRLLRGYRSTWFVMLKYAGISNASQMAARDQSISRFDTAFARSLAKTEGPFA